MAARAKRTTYVLFTSDGRKVTARQVGDRAPVVKVKYRGVGSGRQLRSKRESDLDRERRR